VHGKRNSGKIGMRGEERGGNGLRREVEGRRAERERRGESSSPAHLFDATGNLHLANGISPIIMILWVLKTKPIESIYPNTSASIESISASE